MSDAPSLCRAGVFLFVCVDVAIPVTTFTYPTGPVYYSSSYLEPTGSTNANADRLTATILCDYDNPVAGTSVSGLRRRKSGSAFFFDTDSDNEPDQLLFPAYTGNYTAKLFSGNTLVGEVTVGIIDPAA